MSRATHFGAGKIGRGLVGLLLRRAGYGLTFVDIDAALVDALNAAGRYRVQVHTPEGEQEEIVEGFHALAASDAPAVAAAVAESDVVTTAVGSASLAGVGPLLRKGLQEHAASPINVIACENMIRNSSRLKSSLPGEGGWTVPTWVGFPDCVIDRIVLSAVKWADRLSVVAEDQFEFLVDGPAWVGDAPSIAGLTLVESLHPYAERKLWLVNGLHAATAYLGRQRGHGDIQDAVADAEIRGTLEGMAGELGALLQRRHPLFSSADLAAYARRSLKRVANPALRDSVTRVGRNPLQKLGADERLVGPARLAVELGLEARHLARAISAALLYTDPDDAEAAALAQKVRTLGWRETLRRHTGLPRTHALLQLVADAFGPLDHG